MNVQDMEQLHAHECHQNVTEQIMSITTSGHRNYDTVHSWNY